MNYYQDKLESLRRIFGSDDILLTDDCLTVNGQAYPIVDDVIVLLERAQYTKRIRSAIATRETAEPIKIEKFAEAVQRSFGQQWEQYSEILEEHCVEFQQYFDLVALDSLKDQSVCDLGCGIGRWSSFLQGHCRELILVDFSDAIFVARKNLASSDASLFFMGDIKRLPFADDFCDFLFSLGVLHHIPGNALDEVRLLRKHARQILVYLYYSLDNRPLYFRMFYWPMEWARRIISSLKCHFLQQVLVISITFAVYLPLIRVGRLLKAIGLKWEVPLYEFYHSKSIQRIRQDVHDRFATTVEHRYSRKEIAQLHDTYSDIVISNGIPYWHFVCSR